MTCLCVIKLPISIRTFIGPPRVVGPCLNAFGKVKVTSPPRGRNADPTGLTDGRFSPTGFGVAKALQTLGVAICFHGFPWEVATAARCLVGCFWWSFLWWRKFWSTKNGWLCVCVCFLFGGRGVGEFQMLPKFFQMVKSDLPCKKLKTKASSIGDSTIFNSVWKERLFAQSLKNFQHSIKSWLRQNKSLDRLLSIYIYINPFLLQSRKLTAQKWRL